MRRASPADCSSMTELRTAIDALDAELLDRFAERMAFIHRAAELKRGIGMAAHVPDRVEAVVRNIRDGAAERGLDPDIYASFWRTLIAAAIAEEEQLLAKGGPS